MMSIQERVLILYNSNTWIIDIWLTKDHDPINENFANNFLKPKGKNKYFKMFGAKKSRNELVRWNQRKRMQLSMCIRTLNK